MSDDFSHLIPDDRCPMAGCDGRVDYGAVENCSCHINPPCSACENQGLICSECGFDTAGDWKAARAEEQEQAAAEIERPRYAPGSRRAEHTSTYVASQFNSTPFSRCCNVASMGTRCANCGAEIDWHDDGLSARRREVGPGNCLMCGAPRRLAPGQGGCCC